MSAATQEPPAVGIPTDSGAGPVASSTADAPQQTYPKGVVLGKDGKPCRSCSSGAAFSAWASQAKKGSLLKSPTTTTDGTNTTTTTTTTTSTTKNLFPTLPPKRRTDCPPDVEVLGRSTWTLLHSIAATYPVTPTPREQADVVSFMGLFSKLYPCWVCAEDFQRYIAKQRVRAGSRDEFGNWLCEAHNEVNRKLGKPVFDCSRWEERWRTGWKDGSCD